jgi:hypothetical protein
MWLAPPRNWESALQSSERPPMIFSDPDGFHPHRSSCGKPAGKHGQYSPRISHRSHCFVIHENTSKCGRGVASHPKIWRLDKFCVSVRKASAARIGTLHQQRESLRHHGTIHANAGRRNSVPSGIAIERHTGKRMMSETQPADSVVDDETSIRRIRYSVRRGSLSTKPPTDRKP